MALAPSPTPPPVSVALSGRSCLSRHEKDILLAIAEAALPPGRVFPGAGIDAVRKLDDFLAQVPRGVQRAARALLWALETSALPRTGRPFTRLRPERRLSHLESWRHADYARRQALRALVSALKATHFHDPALYHQIGCVYGVVPPPSVERPRHLDRVTPASALGADETIECEAVVVGTGAGGAACAAELCERGVAVVMIEEGEYFGRGDFTGHGIEMQRKLYRDMGATFSLGNAWIPIPLGRSVGGSTTINSGTCYRVPARVLRRWRDDFGLSELTPDALAPYYEKVEAVLGVAPAERRYLGGVARVIARGCDALGYRHQPLRRNAPDCDGKGVCCFGCPTDAKRSTNVSYVPRALRAGAQLLTGLRVDTLLLENGRATGLLASAADGSARRVTVRARAVVLCCGSLLTPVLLERNGLCGGSGQLGRNLSIHPATAAIALFDESICGYDAIPQGYAIDEFHDEGILFEGAFAPLDIGAASIPLLGSRFMEIMEAYDRLACFGFMIEDTSRGRVRATRSGRPLITYFVGADDVARLKRGMEILLRIYLAAGARTVLPNVAGFDEIRDPRDVERFRRTRLYARDFDLSAYHPLGTARMGRDPARSVVGPTQEAHEVPGLFVCDGSAVPSSLAVNPQLTIMALASRAAEFVARACA